MHEMLNHELDEREGISKMGELVSYLVVLRSSNILH